MQSSDDPFKLIVADNAVRELRRVVRDGSRIDQLPALVIEVIAKGFWRRRRVDDQIIEFQAFEQFCSADPTPGLGASLEAVRRLCGASPEALNALDSVAPDGRRLVDGEAMTGTERSKRSREGQGTRNGIVDNIHDTVAGRPAGTSVDRAHRALRTHRPDLHAEVLAGTRSAHSAMVEAGFRRRMVSVPLDVVPLVAALRRHLSPDALVALAEALRAEPVP